MAALHPKEARKRLLEMQKALRCVINAHPSTVTSFEMFKGATSSRAWRLKTTARFVAQNILKIDPSLSKTTLYYYSAVDVEELKKLVDNEEAVVRVIWPIAAPHDLDAEEGANEIAVAPTTVPTAASGTSLPSPPVLEGVKQPPSDASPQVVQEWIFTLLHAHTENLIYIRERVDGLHKKIDRCVEILEKLL